MYKWFEYRKKPRIVSISNVEVAMYILHLNAVQEYFRLVILLAAIILRGRMIIPKDATGFHNPTTSFNAQSIRMNHIGPMQSQTF